MKKSDAEKNGGHAEKRGVCGASVSMEPVHLRRIEHIVSDRRRRAGAFAETT